LLDVSRAFPVVVLLLQKSGFRYLSRMDERRTDADQTGRTPTSVGSSSAGSTSVESPSTDSSRASETDVRSLHLWQIQSIRDVLVIGAVAGTIYVGYAMRTVTVPLLIALALAYLVEPLVARMTSWRRMNRPLAVGFILTALGVLLAMSIAIVVPLVAAQTISFAESLRSGRYDGAVERIIEVVPDDYRADVRAWADRVIHPSSRAQDSTHATSDTTIETPEISPETPVDAPTASASSEAKSSHAATKSPTPSASSGQVAQDGSVIARLPESVTQVSLDNPIVSILGAGAGQVYGLSLRLLQLGLVAFLIPFYFYYFSVHWPAIVGFFGSFVPDENRGKVGEIVAEMDRAVAGFVRGRIVICVIMGVMFAIGWQICGVPYGIALGLFTGALSIVPYLGGVGLPFAVLLLVVDQFGLVADERMPIWAMLLWPTVVFVVVQTIEGYLLTPVIAGKATNLDPVTIVVAILAGGSIAGVYGMLLAIPAAACGKIAARRLLLPRIQDWASGRVSDPLPIDAE
jgi:predicted PurR-regulated permease PerM